MKTPGSSNSPKLRLLSAILAAAIIPVPASADDAISKIEHKQDGVTSTREVTIHVSGQTKPVKTENL